MGGQRLSAHRCRVHCRGRRRGGPVRGAAVLHRRHRLVCACLAGHRTCAGRLRGGRRTCAARAGGCFRRGRHACCGERSRARAEAIGTWTGFLMLGFSIGPLVGGAVTHYAGWRFVFWLNVVAMVPAGLMLLRRPGGGGRGATSMDWVGLGALAIFMVTLISGLQALAHVRINPLAAIVPLALAAMAFAGLIWTETRRRQPLADFVLFSYRR